MKFKIDENLPVEFAEVLRAGGHDALTVREENLQGKADGMILDVCRHERRVLLTLDMDFADIRVCAPSGNAGIVVFSLARQDKVHLLRALSSASALFNQEPVVGRLWIVSESRIRVRGE